MPFANAPPSADSALRRQLFGEQLDEQADSHLSIGKPSRSRDS
jgi:hypothetical protein